MSSSGEKTSFGGYADFKLHYAQGAAVSPLVVHKNVGLDDEAGDVIRQVANSAISALTQVRDGINPAELSAAATLIARARPH